MFARGPVERDKRQENRNDGVNCEVASINDGKEIEMDVVVLSVD